eukprot:394676-Rhodomonas_salina.1
MPTLECLSDALKNALEAPNNLKEAKDWRKGATLTQLASAPPAPSFTALSWHSTTFLPLLLNFTLDPLFSSSRTLLARNLLLFPLCSCLQRCG